MLFIPTSIDLGLGGRKLSFEAKNVRRGQLYNLDLDEKLGFQFNPERMEWEEPFDWVSTGTGIYGHDLQYMGKGDVEFDLPLLFIADPAAPKLESAGVREMVSYERMAADFDNVIWLFQRWTGEQPDIRRPSHLRVIYGRHSWDAVIARAGYRIIETFESGNVREGEVMLRFTKWIPIR